MGDRPLHAIGGTYYVEGMNIKFQAISLDRVNQWEVMVTDHFGERTRDVSDDAWAALEHLVSDAISASRESAKTMQGADT